MSSKAAKKAKPLHLLEPVEGKAGVFQVRRAERWEAATAKADRLYGAQCSACLEAIGEEPFVKVDGQPKHYRHAKGG